MRRIDDVMHASHTTANARKRNKTVVFLRDACAGGGEHGTTARRQCVCVCDEWHFGWAQSSGKRVCTNTGTCAYAVNWRPLAANYTRTHTDTGSVDTNRENK